MNNKSTGIKKYIKASTTVICFCHEEENEKENQILANPKPTHDGIAGTYRV